MKPRRNRLVLGAFLLIGTDVPAAFGTEAVFARADGALRRSLEVPQISKLYPEEFLPDAAGA